MDRGERGLIANRLGGVDVAGRLEVRETDARELHDRAVVADQGTVLWLGTSVTGIGKHLSMLVTLPKATWPAYSRPLKAMWDKATPIQPIVINP